MHRWMAVALFTILYLILLCVERDGSVCGGEDVGKGSVEPHNQARAMLVKPSLQVLGVDTTFPMHLMKEMYVNQMTAFNLHICSKIQ